MKNIFYILLLLPTIIFAQYPSNSGQKITLGEQTTADGLVFRGVASIDTVTATSKITRANKQDTSAYILLDTVTNLLWHYKIGSNAWTQAGGGVSVSSFSAGTTGLTPSTATTGAVTLGGTLGGGNGGTGITTFGAVGRIPYASSTTVLTTNSNLLYDGTILRTNQVAIGDTASSNVGNVNLLSLSGGSGAGFTLKSSYDSPTLRSFTFLINALGNVGFWNNNLLSYAYFIQNSNNYLGIGNTSPTEMLHVVGNARITGNIGAGIDVAQARLHVKGSGVTSSTTALKVDNSGNTNLLTVLDNGNVGIGTASPTSATWGKFIQVEATYPGLILNSTASGGVKYSIGADASTLLFRDETTAASRMVITSGGNVGIGTTTDSGYKLDVNGTGRFSGQLTASTTVGGTSAIFQNTGAQNSNGIELRGGTNGTAVNWKIEKDNTVGNAFQLTPSTTNGGTTYTTPVLSIASTGAATFSSSVNVGGVSSNTDFRIYRTVAPNVFFSITAPGGTPNASTLGVNGTDVMVLNASGNVGIGVTPSAWGSSYKAIDLPSGTLWGFNNQAIYLTQNVYFDLAYKYTNTGFASEYYQYQGTHVWRTAPSGTAGTAISFTQAMTLDASGRLGIGTTSPSYKLVSEGSGNAFMYAALSSSIGTIGNWVGYLYGYIGSTYQKGATIFESIDANGRGKFHIALNNVANSSNVSISDAKFTIIPGGNVGIGTTSPTAKLDVNGDIKFKNNLSGEITSSGAQIVFYNNANQPFWINMQNNNNTGRFICGVEGAANTTFTGSSANSAFFGSNAGDLHIISNGAIRQTIKSTGDIGIGTVSPAVQFHTTSNVRFAGLASITDLRTDADGDLFNGSDFNLKNSIDTINFGLSDVLKLKPVSFNWNNEGRNISEYKSMGFIAQDVMDVIPNAASTMGDGDMQVDYNAIVATLTKAIQEQQALIKALEQRILNLENK